MHGRSTDSRAGTMEDAPPLGRLHDAGGRRLMLHRSGTGGPSVVFLPGAGLVGLDFLNVQDRTAELTTSVLYDRAGTGWSEPVDLPRTPAEVAGELRHLLRAAAVPAPYLLVGHSLGAFYARRYAQLFPGEVAGLLLLDPGHEDILDYMPEQAAGAAEQMKPDLEELPELTAEQIQAAREQYAQLHAEWPGPVRTALIEHHLAEWRTSLRETQNFETEVYDELRHGGELPDVPLMVLTAGGENPYWAQFMSEQLMREAHDGVRALHAAMAASVPRGEQRVLEHASHQYMHIQQTDAVLQAIRDLLGR
ncbi:MULTISPECIES: alpha/beta fold hydrolase [Thermomonosporaceae]|uniref:alpha/beta fold hydrolase n=1 Tax=Thermomonosporaceae TaxID=2012 RepID=UPI00255B378D|nr:MULTISPECIES: alpha/beta hydrolase [Thermomonosporaceae]MDL4776846.1 alpha/beta hydrolase [Actinomadura xylanilytica]